VGVVHSLGTESIKRLDELDSLRGLAALTVVFSHFRWLGLADRTLGLSPHQTRIADFVLMPVSAGTEAVILFFVLSGFVLSIPAVDLRAHKYSVFIVRRVFRIYLPYIAALIFAVLGSLFFYSDPSQGDCLRFCWSAPVDWHLFIRHLIFLGEYNTQSFDPPIWSLVQEMRISLIFPMMCALVLKLRQPYSLVCAVSISCMSIIAGSQATPQDWLQPVFTTVHYAMLFVVGIYLAQQRENISKIFRRYSRYEKTVIAVLSALLYVYGGLAGKEFAHRYAFPELDHLADWLTALGAAGIIILSLNSENCSRIMLWGPIRLVGKMSYSIYLLHFIVLLTFFHLFYGRLPLLAIFAICFAVVIAFSYVFYRFVEKPSIQLGRRISGRFLHATSG
jgi:peptidoglycan/LPS O-acetylase OafA/YrhL